LSSKHVIMRQQDKGFIALSGKRRNT